MTHLVCLFVSVCVTVMEETKKPWSYVIANGEWTLEKMLELILTGRCNSGNAGFFGLDLHSMRKTSVVLKIYLCFNQYLGVYSTEAVFMH